MRKTEVSQTDQEAFEVYRTNHYQTAQQPHQTSETRRAATPTVTEGTLTDIRTLLKTAYPESSDSEAVSSIVRSMVEENKELRNKNATLQAEVDLLKRKRDQAALYRDVN